MQRPDGFGASLRQILVALAHSGSLDLSKSGYISREKDDLSVAGRRVLVLGGTGQNGCPEVGK